MSIEGKYLLSVRSYTRPTVDILLDGQTVKRFTANSVDVAKARAVKYALDNELKLEKGNGV